MAICHVNQRPITTRSPRVTGNTDSCAEKPQQEHKTIALGITHSHPPLHPETQMTPLQTLPPLSTDKQPPKSYNPSLSCPYPRASPVSHSVPSMKTPSHP